MLTNIVTFNYNNVKQLYQFLLIIAIRLCETKIKYLYHILEGVRLYMDKRKIENMRVKKNITEALLSLLEEKSISKITVSEIITRAGVARASFYRNYATKENVITTLISDVLEQYRADLHNNGEDFYTYENTRRSFEFFSRYDKIALDLQRFGYGSILLEMLNQFHEEVAGSMSCKSIERYKLYIYMGSLYNTAMVWLQSGKKESIDEITDMFYQICVIRAQLAFFQNS